MKNAKNPAEDLENYIRREQDRTKPFLPFLPFIPVLGPKALRPAHWQVETASPVKYSRGWRLKLKGPNLSWTVCNLDERYQKIEAQQIADYLPELLSQISPETDVTDYYTKRRLVEIAASVVLNNYRLRLYTAYRQGPHTVRADIPFFDPDREVWDKIGVQVPLAQVDASMKIPETPPTDGAPAKGSASTDPRFAQAQRIVRYIGWQMSYSIAVPAVLRNEIRKRIGRYCKPLLHAVTVRVVEDRPTCYTIVDYKDRDTREKKSMLFQLFTRRFNCRTRLEIPSTYSGCKRQERGTKTASVLQSLPKDDVDGAESSIELYSYLSGRFSGRTTTKHELDKNWIAESNKYLLEYEKSTRPPLHGRYQNGVITVRGPKKFQY